MGNGFWLRSLLASSIFHSSSCLPSASLPWLYGNTAASPQCFRETIISSTSTTQDFGRFSTSSSSSGDSLSSETHVHIVLLSQFLRIRKRYRLVLVQTFQHLMLCVLSKICLQTLGQCCRRFILECLLHNSYFDHGAFYLPSSSLLSRPRDHLLQQLQLVKLFLRFGSKRRLLLHEYVRHPLLQLC